MISLVRELFQVQKTAVVNKCSRWIENPISRTLLLSSTAWPSKLFLLQPEATTRNQISHAKEFHSSASCCKYHDLKKRRTKVKRKMSMLTARLERLDKEDRPTGCLLCPMKGDIEIDHKNVRLLSQFISPHTGRIYGRSLTGLCGKKQKEITGAIKRSRALGFMPVTMKFFEFHNDPKVF